MHERKDDTQSILLGYDLPHPPVKAWRALTEPELLAAWLMANDLRTLVRYSWRSGPASSPLDTVVTWTLTPTPSGGTRLTLEHSGFLPANVFAFDGARNGWQRMVGERLSEVLARTA